MRHRRSFLAWLGAAWCASSQKLFAQKPFGQTRGNHAEVLRVQPLSGEWEGWEAEFNVVTAAPGRGFAPHRHKGFVLGYVLEGTFQFATEVQDETTLRPGMTFFEPSGVLHTVTASGDPSRDAKVLAIVVRPKEGKSQ